MSRTCSSLSRPSIAWNSASLRSADRSTVALCALRGDANAITHTRTANAQSNAPVRNIDCTIMPFPFAHLAVDAALFALPLDQTLFASRRMHGIGFEPGYNYAP
mmetsp:Transcript_29296/g.56912  ORF Transcript_29296/g.56912 Transcript_29296/m.56912 type:complete len:104 (+) Transcript_29296:4887-5198(+)